MATILIIDDDTQLREMLKQLLERQNYDVIEAKNGNEGVQAFRLNRPDLVITDLVMPEKDGVMAIQELLVEFPRARIVAMSGGSRGNPAWLPIAQRLGALRIITKPFSNDQLIDTISSALSAQV